MPVYRCIAGAFGQLCVSDAVDQLPVDLIEFLSRQKRIDPTQLAPIAFVSGLVSRLLEVSDNRIFLTPPRSFAKLLKPPRLSFQLVVEFFRLGFVFGLSASTYSLAVGRAEVDPPDRTSFA
jgi:hypothetical protein